jgi:hypothetical protein
MSMVANAYVTNHDLSDYDIVELLTTGFSGTLSAWWDKHLTQGSKDQIKIAVKIDNDRNPILKDGKQLLDGVNTLIYTIIKHFVGTPSNITSRISNYLNNLRCPSMSDYKWYQDVFLSCVMLRTDSFKPYWKEKFIDGLSSLFAHKVKDELVNPTIGFIDYENLIYGDLFSIIKKRIHNIIRKINGGPRANRRVRPPHLEDLNQITTKERGRDQERPERGVCVYEGERG